MRGEELRERGRKYWGLAGQLGGWFEMDFEVEAPSWVFAGRIQ